jgi:hypothetical protein
VLLVGSLAQLVVAAGLVLALDSVAAILVLAAVLGTGFAFAHPAELSLVPVVAGGKRLTEVNGLVETARYTGMTAGPPVGGPAGGLGRHGDRDARERVALAGGISVAVGLVGLAVYRRPLPSAEPELAG